MYVVAWIGDDATEEEIKKAQYVLKLAGIKYVDLVRFISYRKDSEIKEALEEAKKKHNWSKSADELFEEFYDFWMQWDVSDSIEECFESFVQVIDAEEKEELKWN